MKKQDIQYLERCIIVADQFITAGMRPEFGTQTRLSTGFYKTLADALILSQIYQKNARAGGNNGKII